MALVAGSLFTQAQTIQVNDSLNWHHNTPETKVFVSKIDSANQLLIPDSLAMLLRSHVSSLIYNHGVGYLIHGDSSILFQVDMRSSGNVVKINGKALTSGMSEKKFRRKFRSLRSSKVVAERKKGVKENAYTLFTDAKTGISYRAYFKDKKLVTILLYLPPCQSCKQKN